MIERDFVADGRAKKAKDLADVIQGQGIPSGRVAGFTEEQWNFARCACLQKKMPSDETRALTIKLMRDRERAGRVSVEQQNRLLEEHFHG